MKMSQDAHHHFEMKRKKCLGVNTTKETANSVLLAVESCLPVDFATTMSATTQWIGKLSDIITFISSWVVIF